MSRASERLGALGGVVVTLWAAHLLGDHAVQTDAQARDKTSPVPDEAVQGMAGHLVGYHVTQGLALALTSTLTGWRPRPGRLAAGMAFSLLTHGVLDRREPVRRLLAATGSPSFADPHIDVDIPVVRETPHGIRGAALMRSPSGVRPVEGDSGAMFTEGDDGNLYARVRAVLPLHGMYLTDQTLHVFALLISGLIMTGGDDG